MSKRQKISAMSKLLTITGKELIPAVIEGKSGNYRVDIDTIIKHINVGNIDIDLSNYYTKEDINNMGIPTYKGEIASGSSRLDLYDSLPNPADVNDGNAVYYVSDKDCFYLVIFPGEIAGRGSKAHATFEGSDRYNIGTSSRKDQLFYNESTGFFCRIGDSGMLTVYDSGNSYSNEEIDNMIASVATTGKLGGMLNITDKTAIQNAQKSLTSTNQVAYYIITDSSGKLPSKQTCFDLSADNIKQLSLTSPNTLTNAALSLVHGRVTVSPIGVNVGDMIALTRVKVKVADLTAALGVSLSPSEEIEMYQYRIISFNDAKAPNTNGIANGVMGLMTPSDKAEVSKIGGIEWTANHVRDNYLPKADLLPSIWGTNMDNCLNTGVYPWCTLGRPSGSTGAYTCIVKRTSTNDGSYDTIEQTAYGREGESGRVFKRIIFQHKNGSDTQYGNWIELSGYSNSNNQLNVGSGLGYDDAGNLIVTGTLTNIGGIIHTNKSAVNIDSFGSFHFFDTADFGAVWRVFDNRTSTEKSIFCITRTGLVGIGLSKHSPSYMLDVEGSIRSGDKIYIGSNEVVHAGTINGYLTDLASINWVNSTFIPSSGIYEKTINLNFGKVDTAIEITNSSSSVDFVIAGNRMNISSYNNYWTYNGYFVAHSGNIYEMIKDYIAPSGSIDFSKYATLEWVELNMLTKSNSISVGSTRNLNGYYLYWSDYGLAVNCSELEGITADDDGLSVKIDSGLYFTDKGAIAVKYGSGLGINSNGELYVTISGGSSTPVVDNLTSTSTTSALSANQGKVLNNKFSNVIPWSNVGTYRAGVSPNIPSNPPSDRWYIVQKMTENDDSLMVNVPWTDTDTKYTLSVASSSALGGIKIGYSANGKNYPVQLDANNKAYVNVPWTDTKAPSLDGYVKSSDLGTLAKKSSIGTSDIADGAVTDSKLSEPVLRRFDDLEEAMGNTNERIDNIEEQIGNLNIPSLDSYATKQWVKDQGYTATSWVEANFIAKDGGTIQNNDIIAPLHISGTASKGVVGIDFQVGGYSKGQIRAKHDDDSVYLYTTGNGHTLGIKDDGTAFIDNHYILHSGNLLEDQGLQGEFNSIGSEIAEIIDWLTDLEERIEEGSTTGGNSYTDLSVSGILTAATITTSKFKIPSTTNNYEFVFEDSNGAIFRPNGTYRAYVGTQNYPFYEMHSYTFSQTSDATKKNILGNTKLTLSQIANAPAVDFTWRNSGEKSVGTIAQYWKSVLPEVVSGEEGSMGMNYATLGVVASIVIARSVETNAQRISRLEMEIENLQKELASLNKSA